MAKFNNSLNKYLLEKFESIYIDVDNAKPTEKKIACVKAFEAKMITRYAIKFSDELFDALTRFTYDDLKETFSRIEKEIVSWKATVTNVYTLFLDFPHSLPDSEDAYIRTIAKNVFGVSTEDSITLDCGCHIKAKDIKRFGGCPVCGKTFNHNDIKKLFKDKQLKKQEVEEKDFFLGLKTVGLITKDKITEVFTKILSQQIPPSKDDINFLSIFCSEYDNDDIVKAIPKKIEIKDTIIDLILLLRKNYASKIAKALIDSSKLTTRDIMKLIKSFSEARNTTKIKLSNCEKELVLYALNKLTPEIVAKEGYPEREFWKHVAYLLHIKANQVKIKYPKACEGLYKIAYTKDIRSFDSELNIAFEKKDTQKIISMLKTKPGVMVRNLLRVIKVVSKDITATATLHSILPALFENIKTPLLLQVLNLLRVKASTNENMIDRVFIPKGTLAKMFLISEENNISTEEKAVMLHIANIIETILSFRFSENQKFIELLQDKKKIFISEALKDIVVPLSQKSATSGFQMLPRGSCFSFSKELKTLRLFCYWKAATDIDLSASFINKNGDRLFYCSYIDLNPIKGVIHSGDLRSAENGGHEFVDIDIEEVLKKEIKYIIITVNSYSGEPFTSQSCCIGILGIAKLKEQILLDPKKVMFKQDLKGDSQYNIPIIVDIEERKIYISDININAGARDNIASKQKDTERVLKGIQVIHTISPKLYDLINLYAQANSSQGIEVVETKDEAEFIFDFDADFSPYRVNDTINLLN